MAQLLADSAKPKVPVPQGLPLPDLGHAERATFESLRKGARKTQVLNDNGSTKRARERLVNMKLIEPCGSGKSKRGVWKLTALGHDVLVRIDAGD